MNNITIGMDLGDRKHVVCAINADGDTIDVRTINNGKKVIVDYFRKYPRAKVAMEVGTHSPWISRLLTELDHEVLVGNSRKLRVIWESDNKSDIRDAEMLARICRFDPDLLYPLRHRGEKSQIDLALVKGRETLVKSRANMISFVRSIVKSFGARIATCSSASFHKKAVEQIPEELKANLLPVVEMIESLTLKIREYDKNIERISEEYYPETACLRQIAGVGPLTSLVYILTLEETERFPSSRQVGPFLGLTPKRDQSGFLDKQLRITKAGNGYLRKLLVGSAQYILGPFGPDCNLKRFGLRIAERGGKNAKRRAVVAVARKLSILMHRLWRTGEVYDPFYKHSKGIQQKAA